MASALGSSEAGAAEAGVAGVAAAMPPHYVEFKEAARAEMLLIRQKMGELRTLHGRATLSKFDDSRDEEVQASAPRHTVHAGPCMQERRLSKRP